MLKRKWIVDNAGRLVGIWNDNGRPYAAHAHLCEQSVLNAARRPGSRRAAGEGWFRYVRLGSGARSLILGAVVLFFPAAAVWGDVGGKITGTAKDQSGGVVPGSTASAVNAATGVSLTTTTNEEGAYAFPVLQVGQYEIDVTANRFRPYRRTEREPCRTANESIHGHRVSAGSFSRYGPPVSPAATRLDGWAPPSQRPLATGTLVHHKAPMGRAGRHETEIPDRPPDRAFAEATWTRPGSAYIELVAADQFATEGPQLTSPRPRDSPIAHGKPLFGVKP
jgi:hypothetical protein